MNRLAMATLLVALLTCCHDNEGTASVDAASDIVQAPRDLPLQEMVVDLADDAEVGCVEPPDLAIETTPPDAAADAREDSAADATGDAEDAGVDAGADEGVDGDLTTAVDLLICTDASSPCPPCMILVNGTACVDQYEASRPDATASSAGVDESRASCAAGVLPWFSSTLTVPEAQQACAAAGKRLCGIDTWQSACSGAAGTVYGYGDSYDPTICNGIDRFCSCGTGSACENTTPCPYPHCFKTCGAAVQVQVTGSHPLCASDWGIYDINGNVWEMVHSTDGLTHYRGGAYNCINSELLHRCDNDVTSWAPLARGFRCCADPC